MGFKPAAPVDPSHSYRTPNRNSSEIRVSERTRIARDLHDTLLQSFHGVLLLFQTANEYLPLHPVEAKQALHRAIGCAERAITEGRDAVQDLRLSSVVDLAQTMNAFTEELAAQCADGGSPPLPIFRVRTEGSPQLLHPTVCEEICRISLEALRNAFRHAQARGIEVEIIYGDALVQVRIQDDGKGIDATIVDHGGRAGHWGLAGMHERAARIGAKLDIWSRPEAGTKVELSLPSSVSEPTSVSLDEPVNKVNN